MEFQSTCSAREQDMYLVQLLTGMKLFQSTCSAREQDEAYAVILEEVEISIHLLRKGARPSWDSKLTTAIIFQSTCSAREQDNYNMFMKLMGLDFNPLAPQGSKT